MRLSLLLEREPFGPILEATLAHYWSARHAQPTRVHWHRPGAGPAGAQEWRGNVFLNYFTVAGTSTATLAVIRHEFGRNRSPWLRPAQAAYVGLATARATRRWFAQVAFSVTPGVEHAAGTFIVPGNHRIRLLRPEANSSVVVLKHGFPAHYLGAEISARQSVAATLAPPLLEVAADGTWFAECYIEGTPANRLSAPQENEAIAAAVQGLRERVIAPTLQIESAADCAERAEQRIETMLQAPSVASEPDLCQQLRDSTRRLGQLVRAGGQLGFGSAQTHGDLQPGNILSTRDRVWLIDWEGAARRLALYDLLCQRLNVRLDVTWGERLGDLRNASPHDALPTPGDWPGVDWSPSARTPLLAAFVLEEMCYVLEDALQPFRLGPSDRLRRLGDTVRSAEKQLAS